LYEESKGEAYMKKNKDSLALSGKSEVEFEIKIFPYSNFYFVNFTEFNPIVDWESLGFKKNSKSIFDYERGKKLMYKWNLTNTEYDIVLKSLVNYLDI
jgi:hypothetical protein